jgi:hypothetical protein
MERYGERMERESGEIQRREDKVWFFHFTPFLFY